MNAPQPFADYVASREPGDDFKAFPCRAGRKEPACLHGHLDATADPEQLKTWAEENPAYNVATCPEDSGFFVLDVDPGNGGDQSLAALEATHAPLPRTYTVRTPRGGRHLWFCGSAPSSAGKIGPGLDIRGRGGYVLWPGSVTEHGQYTVESDVTAAEAPPWLINLATAPKHEPRTAPDGFEFDQSWNVDRATQHAKTCQPAIQGQGGDSRTLQVACELRDLGCSEETTLPLMQEHFNPRCEPEWNEDELEIKIANAFRYAQNQAGCHSLEDPAKFLAHCRAHLISETPAIGPVKFRDVLARTVAPVREIIAGLIEKGTVVFLSGAGGSNKSRIGLHWGLSVEAGVSVYGRAVEHAHFVDLSYEDHPDEVTRRAQAIAGRLKLPVDSNADYWDLCGRDAPLAIVTEEGECHTKDLWDRLHAHLLAIAGHKFLVIDSTYNALRFVGSAKINEGAVMAAIGLMQRLCDECDCTILMLWHPSQAGQERGDASGWSVAWHNAPRARLSITPVKDCEDVFELKVEKRNHGPKGKPITLHWNGGMLEPLTAIAEGEQVQALEKAVVRVAIMAAEAGCALQRQRRLIKWQLDEIEKDIGRRPSQREVKEVLEVALPRQRLKYLKGTTRHAAGYYPPDPERADELAREAKHQAQGEDGHA